MVATVLLTAGTSLATLSVVPYIRNIIRGKTKPRIVSWVVWAILLGLTSIVSWQEGQVASAVLATTSTLACVIITTLAVRYTTFTLTRLERYTLLGALIGVVLWLVFDDPMLVLLAALTVDAIAYLPTYVNGWQNPHHESLSMFVVSTIGSSLVLAAAVLNQASSHGLVYPIYSVVFASIMITILVTRRKRATVIEQV